MAKSEKDINEQINTIIAGEMSGESIRIEKDIVYVGAKVLSIKTCEKVEVISDKDDSTEVKKVKKKNVAKIVGTVLFPPAAIISAKNIYNEYQSYGDIVRIKWRNGTESDAFVTKTICKRIQSMFY